jgi:ribosome-associated protein
MPTTARPRRAPRRHSDLEKLVLAALDEMKAVNVKVLDVRTQTDVADAMIVASGNSDRHVRAIAQHVIDKARETRRRPLGVEGTRDGEWVLVDLQDVVVHVMLPRVREFYAIEQLWEPAMASLAASRSEALESESAPTAAAGAPGAAGARRARPRTRARPRPRSTS